MRPSSCTGQVLGHTTAPGPPVTGPTAAALSRALLNVSMPLLGRDRARMAWASDLDAEQSGIRSTRLAILAQSIAGVDLTRYPGSCL